jgi:hypothetical protein
MSGLEASKGNRERAQRGFVRVAQRRPEFQFVDQGLERQAL